MDSAFAAAQASLPAGPSWATSREPHDRERRSAAIVSQPPARVVPIAAISIALLLAACGSPSDPSPAPCPTVLFLKGAERTADYVPGPSPRPADLRYLAVLADLVSLCRYEGDNVDVALRFNLVAEQGPAYGGGPLQLTYFVASLGPDQQVLSKPLFDAVIEFPAGQQRAGSSQEMTVHMPKVTPATGPQHSVFVGFQLDDAEMRRRLEPEP